MVTTPLISIAICTYNGIGHLASQLESAINQDYPNKEVIVIDDKSTDRTFEIIKEYQKQHPFITAYQNEENLGYIKNFEKAISLCNGEYIALCDQDDIWDLKKISTLYHKMDSDSILIYHDSELIDQAGNTLNKTLSESIGYIEGSENRNLLLNNCIAGHTMMFRSSLKNNILPFTNSIPHDHWIGYIALTVGKIQFFNEVLVKYRQHEFSLTYTKHAKDNQRLKVENCNQKKEKLKLVHQRIAHLKALKSFNGNTPNDLKVIVKLISLLSNKPADSFAYSLFWTMIWYQRGLFKLYHKSVLSTVLLIYKECKP